ncbi:hypothetical protein VOLCADRAFT_99764 [Volvox carteri f. nagariensis]|uniref:Uncharacterized protein n=1 Tax=Volvox carteri f. nagariensis TaxID=3068 RepID=D8UIL1_VOLCA|nr:uncharacterized protein VOLCADRAFT_99764 [Volvox carteri f. nagariensis]EFJ40432.1 hypothetical protein VOLCADRAFT_99764 [Volvox carteri f. nagariensis]|eukprot:XP_002958512.1 hypothetical protein VOLCADRAFT_99764 [Volvox carteri f. nagariensis]
MNVTLKCRDKDCDVHRYERCGHAEREQDIADGNEQHAEQNGALGRWAGQQALLCLGDVGHNVAGPQVEHQHADPGKEFAGVQLHKQVIHDRGRLGDLIGWVAPISMSTSAQAMVTQPAISSPAVKSRFMYVRGHPRGREGDSVCNVVVGQESHYDASLAPLAATQAQVQVAGLSSSDPATLHPDGAFMEYDDFYGWDHQYTSVLDGTRAGHAGGGPGARWGSPCMTTSEQLTVNTREMDQEGEAQQDAQQAAKVLSPPSSVAEGYINSTGANASHMKHVCDLLLYVLSGIFLILIMEQFLWLGMRMNSRVQSCFDAILGRCRKRMQAAVKTGVLYIVFDVPEFMIGHPPYNICQCITYLMAQLTKAGFTVRYLFPRALIICWGAAAPPPPVLPLPPPPVRLLEAAAQHRPPPAENGAGAAGPLAPRAVLDKKPGGKLTLDI